MLWPDGVMNRPVLVLLALTLAACDSPSPDFGGLPGTRVTVDGSTFAVRRKGNTAQAIRLNREWRAGVMARGFIAIEQATGCEVRPGTLSGDPAVIYARITCAEP
ncbi:hypothetical protein [Rhodovulum euryhalinum]|uniref:Uncharacterized protein n=1 Tax=Rhodovulum euryhalinum TaxID=35805 RepID=A0A4R2K993_9RHOB|nr:hypothetical protein [Rhodovulum euryhalinum]TCO69963.1 hypothetical protein EV655_11291 [Rhodovulum euryhalinum]